MGRKVYLALAVLLSACGGSSGSGSSSTAGPSSVAQIPQAPTPTSLSGSGGDLNKYLGTWLGVCGTNILGGTSAINVFTFTQVSGTVVNGTLTTTSYNSANCSGNPSTILPNSYPITMSYVSSVSVVNSGTGGSTFTGTADYLLMANVGSTNTTNTFIGFKENNSTFILSTTGAFSQFNVTYTKL